MYLFKAKCPACGRVLNLGIDTSCGISQEASAECECGGVPVFAVEQEPQVGLGSFKYWERPPKDERPPSVA